MRRLNRNAWKRSLSSPGERLPIEVTLLQSCSDQIHISTSCDTAPIRIVKTGCTSNQ